MVTKLSPVGRNAAAVKYDILTAISAWALARSKHDQRLALRFLCLITARYNWQRDLLAIGQREIAKLWQCDERTVKREMARLRAHGWLVLHRQGHRGRVAQYGLDIEAILKTSQPVWENVGPDFALRVAPQHATNVVPLIPKDEVPPPDLSKADIWSLAQGLLHTEDAGLYGAWLQSLTLVDRVGGRLTLKAPSRFHGAYVANHLRGQILAACQAVDGDVTEIAIVG